ncbi:hypothetical protein DBR06_SOUSAS13810021, partial [Sousa chinensis]
GSIAELTEGNQRFHVHQWGEDNQGSPRAGARFN